VDLSKVTPLRAIWYGFKLALAIYIFFWILEFMQLAYNWIWRIWY